MSTGAAQQKTERKINQDEIIAKTKLISQSLASLKAEHSRMLSQLSSSEKDVDEKLKKLNLEKEDTLKKSILSLELGIEESQV